MDEAESPGLRESERSGSGHAAAGRDPAANRVLRAYNENFFESHTVVHTLRSSSVHLSVDAA